MLGTAINRSWQQLLHPKFRSVFLKSVFTTFITLTILTFSLNHYWPETFHTGWGWLDTYGEAMATAGFWAVVTIGTYLLFPGIVTMVMGLLADQIATAVEEEYYPHRIGTRKVPYGDMFLSAAKLTALMILINLLALVPYILLFFVTGGIGTLILFITINGYLIGHEYFEMVALRHRDLRTVTMMRKTHGNKVFMAGAVIAAMFLVPIVNLIAPIVGAAIMTHIYHHLPATSPR